MLINNKLQLEIPADKEEFIRSILEILDFDVVLEENPFKSTLELAKKLFKIIYIYFTKNFGLDKKQMKIVFLLFLKDIFGNNGYIISEEFNEVFSIFGDILICVVNEEKISLLKKHSRIVEKKQKEKSCEDNAIIINKLLKKIKTIVKDQRVVIDNNDSNDKYEDFTDEEIKIINEIDKEDK